MRRLIVIGILFFVLAAVVNASENVSETDITTAISQIGYNMQDMADLGFGISYVNDSLMSIAEEFKTAKQSDYPAILKELQDISLTMDKAYEINDMLRAFELRLRGYGESLVDTSRPHELLQLSKQAFKEERYNDAEVFLNNAQEELDANAADVTLVKVMTNSAKAFLQRYWIHFLAILLILIISGLGTWRITRIIKAKKSIKDLLLEKTVINKMIKESQEKRYSEYSLSSKSYGIKMEVFKDRLIEIDHIIPVLESIIKKKKKGHINS